MTRIINMIVTGALVALTSFGAQADEHGDMYVDVLGVGGLFDSEKAVEDGFAGFSGRIGKQFSERWNLELAANAHDDIDGDPAKAGVDLDQFSVGANALAVFNRDGAFQPFFLAGLGGVDSTYEGNGTISSRGYYYDLGVGAIVPIFDGKGRLRAEVIRRAEDDAFDSKDYFLSIGFGIPFGKKAEPVVVAAVVVAPVDSDGDGVTDDLDRCPRTPAGAAVDASGCELDSDGDGVVDRLDQCPGTPVGVVVDEVGCPVVVVINLEGVTFRTNAAELAPGAADVLDLQAATLIANPDVTIEVAGHTDSDGEAGYNLDLSQRRADTVRDYLVAKGVDADRITAVGYGESEPVASNDRPIGKAMNRRVELRITNQ